MFDDMQTWQWVALAALGAVFVWPRRDAVLSLLSGVFGFGGSSSDSAKPDANAVAEAYWTIAPYLTAETAKQISVEVGSGYLLGGAARSEAPTKTDAPSSAATMLKEIIRELAASEGVAIGKSGGEEGRR